MSPAGVKRRELHADLAARRQELRLAVDDLRTAAARWRDPGEYVRARPASWLLGAALVGWWIGARRR